MPTVDRPVRSSPPPCGGLANVKHRGAVAADARTSDGTGLLTTIPPAIFGEGVGVVGLFVRGADPTAAVEAAALAEGLEVVEWRTPPTDESALGELAAGSRPGIVQALIRPTVAARAEVERLVASGAEARLGDVGGEDLERRAYRMRRRIDATTEGTYVVSCSFRTIVYKGLVAADALADFYLDLADERFEAHLAVFHQRFSTNTLPTWERAQPFRLLCHNGEINTIDGNENRMRARARLGTADVGPRPRGAVPPRPRPRAPATRAMLDEAAELLVRGGRDLRHAMAMLVPEAWEETRDLDPEVRGFYELPLRPHGAVGRTGRRDLHRRRPRRRRARPQRAATAALRPLRGRPRRVRLGDGRGRHHRPRHRRPGSARARPHDRRRARRSAPCATPR